jgi:hypothetical protein
MADESQDLTRRLRGRLKKPSPEEAARLEERSASAQPHLHALVGRIANGDGDIYALTHELYRSAMTAVAPTGANGERAMVLYLLWATFDDAAERLSARTPELEDAMRNAAREWLEIGDADRSAWRPYLDRWKDVIRSLPS